MGNRQSKKKWCCNKQVDSPLPIKVPSELLGGMSNDKTLNRLIERHTIGSRNMLAEKCVGCDGRILLVWRGDIPLFLHQQNNGFCTADPITESACYRLAKKYILNYFKKGGKIIFTSKCEKCSKLVNTHLPNLPITVIENTTYIDKKHIEHNFDIGIFALDRYLILGINICSFNTLGIYSQANVSWSAILDMDALIKLDIVSEEPIVIQDHRSDIRCSKCQELYN